MTYYESKQKDVLEEIKQNNFLGFAMKSNCNVRTYNAIKRYDINEKTDLTDLSKYYTIGLKSGLELRQLQKNYIKKH